MKVKHDEEEGMCGKIGVKKVRAFMNYVIKRFVCVCEEVGQQASNDLSVQLTDFFWRFLDQITRE